MAIQELPPRHLSFPFIIPVSVFVVVVADPVVVSSLHVSHAYDAFHASIHPIHPRKSTNQTAESLVSARLTPLHPFVSSILRLPPPPFQSFQPITNRDLRSQLLPVVVLSHRFPLFAITAATISRRAKLPRHTDAVDVPTPHFCSFAPGLTAAFISSQLYMETVVLKTYLQLHGQMQLCQVRLVRVRVEVEMQVQVPTQLPHPLQHSTVGCSLLAAALAATKSLNPGPKVLDWPSTKRECTAGSAIETASMRRSQQPTHPTPPGLKVAGKKMHSPDKPHSFVLLCIHLQTFNFKPAMSHGFASDNPTHTPASSSPLFSYAMSDMGMAVGRNRSLSLHA
ncbi:hypothetical protein CFIO01_12119 [Colletotrichum fioriniae PJ7]|uniref:Uncharacterized protein n=1 Tax=Colletotrichum fioriniae PJ7 TaxID=1445577 RepID=A0A010SHL2_9PEZI|nr:hypothetical protein CFIO01_12119 [Colletotrichum fioriniae PJ7]